MKVFKLRILNSKIYKFCNAKNIPNLTTKQ